MFTKLLRYLGQQIGNPSRRTIEDVWRTLLSVRNTQLEEKRRESAICWWEDPKDGQDIFEKENQNLGLAQSRKVRLELNHCKLCQQTNQNHHSTQGTIKWKRSDLNEADLLITLEDLGELGGIDPLTFSRCLSLLGTLVTHIHCSFVLCLQSFIRVPQLCAKIYNRR